MVSYPNQLTQDAKNTLEEAVSKINEITIENRIYALDESDLPDDKDVKTDNNDLPYYVDGERPFADEIAIGVDSDGDARIAVQWNSRLGHWKEDDYASWVYDALESVGIPRPTYESWKDDSEYDEAKSFDIGVQFGSDGNVAVENIIPNGTKE